MKVFLGSDHNGATLQHELAEYLRKAGYDVVLTGEAEINPEDDYPLFAQRVVHELQQGAAEDRGILICGSGQGMCMAANRFKGIRAALLYDRESARSSRNDDDSNVACLPARVLREDEANHIIDTWLQTPFARAPRYVRRIREMDDLS